MTENDLDPLYKLLSDPRVMLYLEPPYDREKTREFLIRAGLSEPPLVYSVDKDGGFIGYVIYHDYDEDSVEIGWVLYPDHWRKGYASRLTALLKHRAISEGKQAVIECAPGQSATRHIAEKCGFDYEGRIDGLDVFRFKER